MKKLKKVNKGAILTLIVLTILTIYLVNLEKQREEEKVQIKNICEKYIEFTDKYTVLPEELQKLPIQIAQKQTEDYKKEIETELKKLMISNEEVVELQYQILVSILKKGYNNNEVKSKTERQIIKTGYEFEGNQVTVTFKSKVKNTTKYLNQNNEEQERQSTFETFEDEIMLQKIDEEWKIVYTNLQYDDYNSYLVDTQVNY